MKKLCTMGAYCHSHSFHPIGPNHNSRTCTYKLDSHKDDATWTNRLGGDMNWPIANCDAVEQQNDAKWKEKTPPTN